jgi:hypothetical protein
MIAAEAGGDGPPGRPLGAKLGIKPGGRVLLAGAPLSFEALLEPLPQGANVVRQGRGQFDVIVLFATRRAELARSFSRAKARLVPSGGLWVAYPKKSSRVTTELSFDSVQQVGLEQGLVDNKSCSVDEVWTAVRFVSRLRDRPRA